MSSYSVELKQHTPLIHFQSKQNGATIRATELKPKIDNFIIEKLKKVDPELYQEYQSVINEDNFPIKARISSKYKISISIASKPHKEEYSREVPYFGNNKDGLLLFKDIKVKVFSYNEKLVQLVGKVLPYVFVFENFGARQGKGFGSFAPLSMSKDKYENILKLNGNTVVYYKKVKNAESVLKQINRDYNLLKSGFNFKSSYRKSNLFLYVNRKNIKSEKAMIKSQLKEKHVDIYKSLKGDNERYKRSNLNNYKYRYVRAMLGLAEHFEYQTNRQGEKINIQICDKDQTIERFKSPIQFKVFENNIYLIINDIPEEMYSREFIFKLGKTIKKDRGKIQGINPNFLTIRTPSKDEFDLCDFIETEIGSLNYIKL